MAGSFENFGNSKVCQLHFVEAVADEDVRRLDLPGGLGLEGLGFFLPPAQGSGPVLGSFMGFSAGFRGLRLLNNFYVS